MKRKSFLIGMNLIAPGIGQMLCGMRFRGALQLLTALSCALWCLVEVFGPIAVSVRNLLSEPGGEIVKPNLWRVGASIGLLLLLYVWSAAEIALFHKDGEEPKDGASKG